MLLDIIHRRSHWPRILRHELSSSAQTLESCVRIQLEVWMSKCVYSLFVLSCVPCDGMIPRPRSPTNYVKGSRN
jgi:hypothetical protein